MLSKAKCLLLFFLGVGLHGMGQDDFYAIDSVQEIRVEFAEPNWADLLDTLFLNGEKDRLIGDVYLNGTLLENVGVRYKGFSSYNSSRVKNPLNIKLNHVTVGQRYKGVDKLKLSNVIQDPSFVREALSYEIARKYMPASEANFARVYVNDVYLGLYTNVEAVNNEFTDKHFGSRNNSFFKGNPSEVDLNGENANLSMTPGADSTQYYDLYDLESEHGWGALLELIDVLNNSPDSITKVLNVDRALWMHALNYTLINFDSYVGYAQNYYIFKDDNERWNTIPWDMNMSFGSFRFSDASLFFSGFSIAQAKVADPLTHLNQFSVFPRPLMRKLFENDTYKRMYLAHMRTMVSENILNNDYLMRATAIQNTIVSHVIADTNKFYSDQMFFDNLDSTVSDVIDYPGIQDLMEDRASYLMAYTGFTGEPAISVQGSMPANFSDGSSVSILATITNADSAFVAFRFDDDDRFEHVQLLDDGLNNDGSAGDGLYGAAITARANLLEYYIYAENDSAGTFSPERAAYEFHQLLSPISAGELVINELMASNEGVVLDGEGESDDWIELLNASSKTISTAELYLTDDVTDPLKWNLPQRLLSPGEYLMIWCDEQEEQGVRHANFQLSASGESIYLFSKDTVQLEQLTYTTQYPISTVGRIPNGTGSFVEMFPSFEGINSLNGSEELDKLIHVYPNPSSGNFNVIVRGDRNFSLQLFAPDGRDLTGLVNRGSNDLIQISSATLSDGMYTLQLSNANGRTQQQLALIR